MSWSQLNSVTNALSVLTEGNNLDDGLADDDSWVENISPIEGFGNQCNSSSEFKVEAEFEETFENQNDALDFTLHTIVEESCEESEFEPNENGVNVLSGKDLRNSDLEKYFFFGLGNGDNDYLFEQSSSEVSDCSENFEAQGVNDGVLCGIKNIADVPASKLEKYFLSGFMGFNLENKSDGSVGSDSEGQTSPNQRKKKYVRARSTPRPSETNDSLLEQLYKNQDSSESETNSLSEIRTQCDKTDDIVKRRKSHRKREPVEQKLTIESEKSLDNQYFQTAVSDQIENIINVNSCSPQKPTILTNGSSETLSSKTLVRKNSFNNWSEDEDTNIMMSRMRPFFKTLIAMSTQKYTPTNEMSTHSKKMFNIKYSQNEIHFTYFENELIRLMKSVPEINSQQVRHIVEYLSSEETWPDSYGSSDRNGINPRGDIELTEKYHQLKNKNFIESFLSESSKYKNELIQTQKLSLQYDTDVMQHIARKLAVLMLKEGNGIDPVERLAVLCKEDLTNMNESQFKDVLDRLAFSIPISQRGYLQRSKSYDFLLGPSSRSWQYSVSNISNDNSGDVSDCDRFSWRGSFESALLATGDSRSKLLITERDNSFETDRYNAIKRSVDNLTHTCCHKRNRLDRVHSCESIVNIEDKNCLKIDQQLHRINVESICSNSLPRLSSLESEQTRFDSKTASFVKSSRYRSPYIQPSVPNVNNLKILQHHTLTNCRRCLTYCTSLDDIYGSNFCSIQSHGLHKNLPLTEHDKNNVFKTQYCSSTSIYSEDYDNIHEYVPVKGRVKFAMQYNYKINALEIYIEKCKDLAAVDSKKLKSDPYVKVYLLPDKTKSGKRKTKVKRHTLNPVFNELFKFHVPIANLETRTLYLTVCHSDIFSRNIFLGEVSIDLKGKVFDEPQSQWYLLQAKNENLDDHPKHIGNIVVCLKFISIHSTQDAPSDTNCFVQEHTTQHLKGQLHILIKEAKNLHSARSNGIGDTFCKSYLLPNRNRHSKQKTPVCKKTLNPVWNFTFVYEDVTLFELSERALELTIWDHDRLASNQFLGGVRFSLGSGKHFGKKVDWMDSNENELALWRDMINRPNFWVEGSVGLRANLSAGQN